MRFREPIATIAEIRITLVFDELDTSQPRSRQSSKYQVPRYAPLIIANEVRHPSRRRGENALTVRSAAAGNVRRV